MRTTLCTTALVSILCASSPRTQEILLDVSDEDGKPDVANFLVPYAFASETYDVGLGLFASTTGRFQDQLVLSGSALGSTNETYNLFFGALDYRVPGSERTFLDRFCSSVITATCQLTWIRSPALAAELRGRTTRTPMTSSAGKGLRVGFDCP